MEKYALYSIKSNVFVRLMPRYLLIVLSLDTKFLEIDPTVDFFPPTSQILLIPLQVGSLV